MTTISGLTNAFSGAAKTSRADLEKAATAFEAIFARQMISTMRSASLGEDIFGSSASEQFRDMADAKTAEGMATSGGLGIAQMLLKQFGGVASDVKDGVQSIAQAATQTDKSA